MDFTDYLEVTEASDEHIIQPDYGENTVQRLEQPVGAIVRAGGASKAAAGLPDNPNHYSHPYRILFGVEEVDV